MAALLKGERYNVGQLKTTVTYYYDCYLRDGTLCQGSATLKPASSARLAASDPSCSPAVKTNSCANQISLAVAAGQFYEKLFCGLSNLVKTREDAVAQLTKLEEQLAGKGLVFPADMTPVVDALVAGQCKQAADLMAAANGQTTGLVTDVNELINGQYTDIEKALVETMEASVSCWGILSWRQECQYVERFLFKLNQAATAKIPLQTAPTQKSTSLIEVTDLTIGQTDYAKISVYYKGDPTQSYVIDVTQYELTADGFVLKDKTTKQVIFEVKVSD